jgi:hypothetical protein
MTNEERLVLCLSRVNFEGQIIAEVEALVNKPISWDAVYTLSLFHGVVSLLHHNVKKHALPVPPEVVERLGVARLAVLARNVRLHIALKEVLDAITREGAEAIVLKGIPLCLYLYGQLDFRPSTDIDLLMRFADLVRLFPLFQSMGYRPKEESFQEESLRVLLRGNWFKIGLIRRDGFPISLELHWNWAQPNRARADMDLAWRQSRIIWSDGFPFRMLSDEDMLVYLCNHLAYHSMNLRQIWTCDIHEILTQRKGTLDWDYVCRQAKRQRLQTPLFLILRYLSKVFGTEIPGEAIDATAVSHLRNAYFRCFLDADGLGYFKHPPGFLKEQVFRLFLIDDPLDRIRFCFDVLAPRLLRPIVRSQEMG